MIHFGRAKGPYEGEIIPSTNVLPLFPFCPSLFFKYTMPSTSPVVGYLSQDKVQYTQIWNLIIPFSSQRNFLSKRLCRPCCSSTLHQHIDSVIFRAPQNRWCKKALAKSEEHSLSFPVSPFFSHSKVGLPSGELVHTLLHLTSWSSPSPWSS